jgi:hypothetical protein
MESHLQEISQVPVFWLPERDAWQNYFTHNFGFLLNPVKKNHPRPAYLFLRID